MRVCGTRCYVGIDLRTEIIAQNVMGGVPLTYSASYFFKNFKQGWLP